MDDNASTAPSPTTSSTQGGGPLNDRSMNASVIMPSDDLLANLNKRLTASASELNTWVKEQKAVCDVVTNRYRQEKTTYQNEIDSKEDDILKWKMEKSCIISDKETASDEENDDDDAEMEHNEKQKESLTQLIAVLQEKVESHRNKLQDLENERQALLQQEKASAQGLSKEDKAKTEEYEELKRTLQGYEDVLGLTFEKAENEALRFSFKGIDKTDRDKEFSFVLYTMQDEYVVEKCNPPVPQKSIDDLVKKVCSKSDDDTDLLNLLLGVRKLWVNDLVGSNGEA